jgi:preprotein translocase subunit SecE
MKVAQKTSAAPAVQRSNASSPGLLIKVRNFFSEVKVELQKASWPWDPKEKGMRRYKELTDSTLVVIIAMLLLGGYVALFDFILVNVVHFFTRVH